MRNKLPWPKCILQEVFLPVKQTCEKRVAAWQVSTIISSSLNLKDGQKRRGQNQLF